MDPEPKPFQIEDLSFFIRAKKDFGRQFVNEPSDSELIEEDEADLRHINHSLQQENEMLKERLSSILSPSNNSSCLCTIVWHNISPGDKEAIETILDQAPINSSPLRNSFVEPKAYYVQKKALEISSDLFMIDTKPVLTQSRDRDCIPIYNKNRDHVMGDENDSSRLRGSGSASRFKGPQRNPCYNCGFVGHSFNDCPEPRDQTAIRKNREAHNIKSALPPKGVISSRLAEVLGIHEDQTPPYYKKMQEHGYPPDFLIDAHKDSLKVFEETDDYATADAPQPPPEITDFASFKTRWDATVHYPDLDTDQLLYVSYLKKQPGLARPDEDPALSLKISVDLDNPLVPKPQSQQTGLIVIDNDDSPPTPQPTPPKWSNAARPSDMLETESPKTWAKMKPLLDQYQKSKPRDPRKANFGNGSVTVQSDANTTEVDMDDS